MRKVGLCTQNTSIHIIVCTSYKIYKICDLHEIPSCINGEQCVRILKIIQDTVYTVIFKGREFHEFRCKLAEHKILILKKKQWLKETMYST